jgi:hypothetical protein
MANRFVCDITNVRPLNATDEKAAEALAGAMAGWDEAALAAYRAAVLDELAAHRKGPMPAFLAVELAALRAVASAADPEPIRRSA